MFDVLSPNRAFSYKAVSLDEIQRRVVSEASILRDFERQSLLCRVSGLSVRVFIPLGRLFSSIDAPSIHLPQPSLLRGFTRSSDLRHLESILRTLESRRFQEEGIQALPTLCRYFEALSVYKGSLTDLHWKVEEDKSLLTVWSMLSYYQHARTKFSGSYSDLITAIDTRLVQALAEAVPILRKISECAEIRECLQYLAFEKIEVQLRKLYGLRMEGQEQEAEGVELWGDPSFLNFPKCGELKKIKEKSFLSYEEKIEQACELWDDFSYEDRFREQILKSEELRAIDDKIRQLDSEYEKKTKDIKRMTPEAKLTQVKRMIQGLYELEQLEVVSRVTESLLRCQETSKEVLIQWLILLRESFRVVLSNQCLNISTRQSISNFSSLIRTIRDYYEHPEDYTLQLDPKPRMNEKAQVDHLECQLFQELIGTGAKIKELVNLRIQKIKQILQPHAHKPTEAVLQALVFRDQKQTEVPQDIKEFMAEKYPSCFSFDARIKRKRDGQSAVSEAKEEEKGKGPSITGPVHEPFPGRITPEEVEQRLKEVLTALHKNVETLSRDDLEKKLEEDLPFRLMIQRKICHSCRLLEQFTRRTRNLPFVYRDERLFERLYEAVRNTRNFQTHDLWRKDVKGIINTTYLLVYDLLNLFSLQARNAFIKEGSFEDKIFQGVVFKTMTQADLQKAIDQGFNVNCCDRKGRSLLHYLADAPTDTNLQLAKFIIERGARVYHADNKQMRPLHYAAQSGFLSLAKLLVDAGSVTDADSEEGTPVELAQSYGHSELARYLSLTVGDQRSSNARALLDAVKNLDLEKVQNLIEGEFDPRADFQGCLPLATLFDREEGEVQTQIAIAKKLVAAGADINQQNPESDRTALHVAASRSDQPEVIQYLMGLDPDLTIQDFQQETPLHRAVTSKNENWVKALLKAGSPVNLRNSSEDTPLLIVANKLGPSRFGEEPAHRIMRALLIHGADVEAENRLGTVLHHVAEGGGVEEVSALVERGASPFCLGKGGVYRRYMPHRVSGNREVIESLSERMKFLFSHLTTEDQRDLIRHTGGEGSPFVSWIQEETSSSDREEDS